MFAVISLAVAIWVFVVVVRDESTYFVQAIAGGILAGVLTLLMSFCVVVVGSTFIPSIAYTEVDSLTLLTETPTTMVFERDGEVETVPLDELVHKTGCEGFEYSQINVHKWVFGLWEIKGLYDATYARCI